MAIRFIGTCKVKTQKIPIGLRRVIINNKNNHDIKMQKFGKYRPINMSEIDASKYQHLCTKRLFRLASY